MRLGKVEVIEAFLEVMGGDHSSVFVSIQRDTARIAANIRSRHNLTLTDAFQVAAALQGGCDTLLTNDKDLSRVTDLKIVLVEELSL